MLNSRFREGRGGEGGEGRGDNGSPLEIGYVCGRYH